AWVLNDLSRPPTVSAGSRDAEKTLLKTDLAIAVAGGAGGWAGTLLCAGPFTFGAGLVTGNFYLSRGAERGFFESDFEVVPQVGASLHAVTAAASPPEHIAE